MPFPFAFARLNALQAAVRHSHKTNMAESNRQFVSWPGLTANTVDKHYLELEETHKGHGRKTRSQLWSTKTITTSNNNNKDNKTHATHSLHPMTKQKTIFFKLYSL
jgi:hypothetical protein